MIWDFCNIFVGMKIKSCLIFICIFSFCVLLSIKAQVIATGGRHSIVLCSDSTVKAWGYNGYGQLGNGNIMEQHSGVPIINLSQVKQLAGGLFHSLFVKSDGTVWASGRNNNGPLGDGTNIDRSLAVQLIGLNGIIQAAGGGEHSLFLKNDGTVWACGLNGSGQLGDGTNISKNIPIQIVGLSDVIQVAAGAEFSLFLKSDGTVWACGHNGFGQFGNGSTAAKNMPVQILGLIEIVQLSAGEWHSLFVKRDGSVFSAGRNNYGQLGDGSTIDKNVPIQIIGLSDIIQADAGGIHSVFVKRDGSVWSCGLNSGGNNDGQLGDGTKVDRSVPVQVINSWGSGKIIYASATREHTLFLHENGTIWACGRNNYGQLGYGSFTTVNSFVPVRSKNICPVVSATINNMKSKKCLMSVDIRNSNSDAILNTSFEMDDATLIFYNYLGQPIKLIRNLFGQEAGINIDGINNGIYLLSILQNQKSICTSKWIFMN